MNMFKTAFCTFFKDATPNKLSPAIPSKEKPVSRPIGATSCHSSSSAMLGSYEFSDLHSSSMAAATNLPP